MKCLKEVKINEDFYLRCSSNGEKFLLEVLVTKLPFDFVMEDYNTTNKDEANKQYITLQEKFKKEKIYN